MLSQVRAERAEGCRLGTTPLVLVQTRKPNDARKHVRVSYQGRPEIGASLSVKRRCAFAVFLGVDTALTTLSGLTGPPIAFSRRRLHELVQLCMRL